MLRNAAADAAVACLCTAMLALLALDPMTISRGSTQYFGRPFYCDVVVSTVAFVLCPN
jgi:hypothetical protein